MKPITAWAGVTDDELELELFPDVHDDDYCRLYRTKAAAHIRYGAVVKVMVVAVDSPVEQQEKK